MMRSRNLVAVLVGGALFLLATPQALAYDRPDLPDYNFAYATVDRTLDGTQTLNQDHIYRLQMDEYYRFATFSRRIAGPSWSVAVQLNLFEPDKVQRKSDKAQMKQGKWGDGYLSINTPGGATLTQQIMAEQQPTYAWAEECKAQVKIRGTADVQFAALTDVKWKYQCKESVITGMGLNATELIALEAVFGTTKKIVLSGQKP